MSQVASSEGSWQLLNDLAIPETYTLAASVMKNNTIEITQEEEVMILIIPFSIILSEN